MNKQHCFQKYRISDADNKRFQALAEKYDFADPNQNYVSGLHDLIAAKEATITAIHKAMAEKARAQAQPQAVEAAATDAAPGMQTIVGADGVARQFDKDGLEGDNASQMRKNTWGNPAGNATITGKDGYTGPRTEVTDLEQFAKDYPGYLVGVEQLQDAGLGPVLDQIDAVYIAEDSKAFNATGALYWNPESNNLELYIDRATLKDHAKLAYTVRHEVGHAADGALGLGGLDKYSSTMPQHVYLEAVRFALTGNSSAADKIADSFEYEGQESKREELLANLFAIATNPNNAGKLSPTLDRYIKGVIQDAKATGKATVNNARIKASREAKATPRRNQEVSRDGQRGGVSQVSAQPQGAQGDGKPVTPLSKPVIEVARRFAGASGASAAESATHFAKKVGLSMLGLHDIVDMYKKTVPAIGEWYKEVQASVATRRQLEQDAEKIALAASDQKKLPNGMGKVNDFLSRSTFEQKWGYDPKIAGKTVTVDPTLERMFKALTDNEQAVVKAVFAHGEKMRAVKQELLKSIGINDLFKGYGTMDGPYAPLKRFGNYVGLLKSKELRAAEEAEDAKLVEKLKGDGRHYVVSYFDTMGQAKQFAQANESRFGWSDAFEKSTRTHEGHRMSEETLQRIMGGLKMADSDEVPTEARDAMMDMIRDMYFQTLDEHNARTSGLQRKNRAGYDADMMRSFLAHARAEAGFLSNMKHGAAINAAFIQMDRQAKNQKTGKREYVDATNMVAKHFAADLNYRETPVQDALMAGTSAWQLATSFGYHVANASQGFMVSLPKLAADFGDYGGAWKHLMAGYGMTKTIGLGDSMDLSRVTDAGLRGALQRASDMGVLDLGMDSDMSQLEGMRTGIGAVDKSTKAVGTVLNKLRKMSQWVESLNRVASATAAYNMAISKGKSVTEAQEYAVRMLQSTQGDFSRMGAPLMLKKLPKLVTQYRKFQFMMAALYAKAFTQAFRGETPEIRAIGRRALGYQLFHASMAAGVMGLPLMNLAAVVASALGSDDEPPDIERTLREYIGDEDMANALLHGPFALAGLDMSAKLGHDKIFSVIPYGEWDFTSATGLKNTVASMAGPAFSQAGRFADGVDMMRKGEYYKAAEKFMPKGIADAFKAYRVANEGYTLKNGDVMVRPDDINGMMLAMDAVGMPSAELKRLDWIRGQQYKLGVFFKERTQDIQRDYMHAHRAGDTDAMAQLREDWMDLQGGKDNLRYLFNDSQDELKRQPLSTLLKYPLTSAKREQKLQKAAIID